jgi:hypothetical protein
VRVTGTANGQPLDVVHVSLDPTSVSSVWRLQIVVPSANGPIEIVPLVDGNKFLQGSLYIFAAP